MAGLHTQFNWWLLVPTLLGAFISIATTATIFYFTQKKDAEKRQEERKQQEATQALSVLHNILSLANILANIDIRISEAFRHSSDGEPSDLVGLILLPEVKNTLSKAQDLKFLVAQNQTGLINDIWELETTYNNLMTVVEEYNRSRREYDTYLHTHGVVLDEVSDRPRIKIEGQKEKIAKVKLAAANRLLASILETLEIIVPSAREVFDSAFKCAKQEFDYLIPMNGVEWGKK